MINEINIKDNGLIILDNIPPGTEVGIDYHVWNSGPHFRGIANIPPGFHFIFFTFVDKYDEKSPRSGFYVFVNAGDIIVKVYDSNNEEMKDGDHLSKDNFNFEDIGKYLAPYPEKECEKWIPLTDYISSELLARIQPVCGKIDFLTTVPVETAGKHMKSVMNVDSRIENSADEDTIIRFSKLPLTFPDGLTPQEISKHSIDLSFTLERVISGLTNGENDLLGELQFSFITFLIGQVYDSFEHWKLLVNMLANCQDCIQTRNSLFLKFIDVISLEMDEIPEDYFIDIAAQNNFLLKTFKSFFENFEDPEGVSGELLRKVSMFKHHLIKSFQWNFDEEDEEDMPVLVEF